MKSAGLLMAFVAIGFAALGQVASQQDGPWSDTNTWDCGCVPDFNDAAITIGHNVTVTADVTVDEVTITTGGSLTINSGVVLTLNEDFASPPLTIESGRTLTVAGTLDGSGLIISPVMVDGNIVNSGVIISIDPSLMTFGSTATYTHSHTTGGDIPFATWDAASSLLVNGMTAAGPLPPNNLNQTFGNFTWNCPSQGINSTFNFGGQLTDVQGTLTFVTSNTKPIYFSGAGGAGFSLTIGQDFINQGAPIIMTNAATSSTTVTVTRDFTQSGGSFVFKVSNNNNVKLEVGRNFSKTGNAFSGGSGTGTATLSFNGGTTQTYTMSGTSPSAVNYEIVNNSTVNAGTSIFTGTGSFTLESGSTLGVGSTHASGAIQNTTTLDADCGNIITTFATRTFASGSTVVYNGTGAQFIGNGHPTAAGVVTQISNTSGVSLFVDTTIGGSLILADLASASNLSVGTRTLTLNSSFVPNDNFLNVTSSSSLVVNGTAAFGSLATTGSTTINNFTINRTSSGTVTLGTDLTVGGTFTQSNGDIILNGHTFTISGPYVKTNGSISADAAASFVVNGSGVLPGSVTFTGSQALNTLTLNRASSTLPTNSSIALTNLNLLSGTFDNTGTITMTNGGVLTRTEGSIINNTPTTSPTTNSYDIVYNIATDITTGSEIPSLSTQLRNITKTGGAQLTLTKALIINGNLTLTNGGFNASTFSVSLAGNLVANSTSTLTSSTVTFNGASTISGGSIVRFGNLTITGSLTPSIDIEVDGDLVNNGTLVAGSGSQTTTFGGTTTISGGSTHNFNNVTVAGTLTAPSSMNVAGTFNLSSGTFNSGSGVVVFSGTSSSVLGAPNFHDITITGTFNAPSSLTIGGVLLVNGTFNAGTGKLVFNGSSNQYIDRTVAGTVAIDLYDITVNKSGGIFGIRSTAPAVATFRLLNEFTISQNGSSNPDVDFDGTTNTGKFVLRSTSSRTGKLTAVPSGATVAGNLTAERYIENTLASRAWRYLASPVTGATVADWLGEIQITGNFSNPSSGAGIPNPNSPSLYRWIETNGGLSSNRYSAYPNNIALPASSFPLTLGQGYSVFVRDTGTPTVDVRGTVTVGDVNISLTKTGSEANAAGYNLVGNPYPAPIDWDLVTIPGNVSSTIAMLDNVENANLGAGTYVYYVQAGPNVGDFTGVIASGQAFWVSASANATLTLKESNKASDSNPIVVREGTQFADLLRINIEGAGRKDETVIYAKDGSTDGLDLQYDAEKRANDYINLYTYFDQNSSRFAINGFNGIGCSKTFNLGLTQLNSSGTNVQVPVGSYTMSFSEMESFVGEYQFSLLDNFAGQTIDLKTQSIYSFQVTTDLASYGENRFSVIISQAPVSTGLPIQAIDVCAGSSAIAKITNSQNNINYYAVLGGVQVSDPVMGNGSALSIEVKDDKLTLGQNNIVIMASAPGCTPIPMSQNLNIKKEALYAVTSVQNGKNCKAGRVTLSAIGAPANGSYHWYQNADDTTPFAGQNGDQLLTPVLSKTRTYYVAAVNALGCEGNRVSVSAEIVNFDDVQITTDGDKLVSSYSSDNQWYLNGELIPGATSQTITPQRSGVYQVETTISGCTTSAEREFAVTGLGDTLPDYITIYPNPTNGMLSIAVRSDNDVQVSVVTLLGTTLMEQPLTGTSVKRGSFNLQDQAEGMYLLVVQDGSKVYNTRIIKKR